MDIGDGRQAGHPVPCPDLVEASRQHAGQAAERVALGLLRAAAALERCADRCNESDGASDGGLDLSQRAEEYVRAARRYRDMAARYRDLGSDARFGVLCSRFRPVSAGKRRVARRVASTEPARISATCSASQRSAS